MDFGDESMTQCAMRQKEQVYTSVNEEGRDNEVILVGHKLYKKTKREINQKTFDYKVKTLRRT